MNTASNVSAGKPKSTGAIWAAPKGTTLPTSTSDTLDVAFKCLGYVSDAGVVNSTSIESNKIKAWGGDTVLVIFSSKEDTYKFTLIEVKNAEFRKLAINSLPRELDVGFLCRPYLIKAPQSSRITAQTLLNVC